jgi:proteasome lid subunit RPN8/RPN11
MEIKLGRGTKNLSPTPDNPIHSRIDHVRIDTAVAEQIEKYALSNTSCELGGILLGTCTGDQNNYTIHIQAAIEAQYTEAGQSSLTFTHQSWDYMNREKEKRYPRLKIMGWFHSHPGFGIFLSSHDTFIQKNFFDLPWLVAYVVDPLGDKAGLFGWNNQQLIPLPFSIDNEPYPFSPDDNSSINTSAPKTSKTNTKTSRSLLLIILIAVLCLTVWAFGRVPHRLALLPESEYYYGSSFIDTLQNIFRESVQEIQDFINDAKNYVK